jgi:hypothetical protein
MTYGTLTTITQELLKIAQNKHFAVSVPTFITIKWASYITTIQFHPKTIQE